MADFYAPENACVGKCATNAARTKANNFIIYACLWSYCGIKDDAYIFILICVSVITLTYERPSPAGQRLGQDKALGA